MMDFVLYYCLFQTTQIKDIFRFESDYPIYMQFISYSSVASMHNGSRIISWNNYQELYAINMICGKWLAVNCIQLLVIMPAVRDYIGWTEEVFIRIDYKAR